MNEVRSYDGLVKAAARATEQGFEHVCINCLGGYNGPLCGCHPKFEPVTYRCPQCHKVGAEVRPWALDGSGSFGAVSVFCEKCSYLGVLKLEDATAVEIPHVQTD